MMADTKGGPLFSTAQALEFPPFHPQLLKDKHWTASDGLGRIRIILSEGFVSEKSTFQRIAPIVAFSTQHAPRFILEASGIAWPIISSAEKMHIMRKRVRDSADMSLDDPPLQAEVHTVSPTK